MSTLETILTIAIAVVAIPAGLWLHSFAYEKRANELYGYKPWKRKRY
jgi:hypothetical protein